MDHGGQRPGAEQAEGFLRTAAYCRVSTDKDDQLNSLAAQQAFFQSYVESRPGWRLVGIFADEGLSGTSLRRRLQFQEMVRRAEQGEIDLIVTKEVSRFARNTVDALQVTRELKAKGVGVLFLNDNIDTRDNDGEFRLTIMASVAQEESRKISERTRWGQLQAMRRGVVFGNDSLYGYTVSGGQLLVRQDQAEVVRMVYHSFLEGRKGAYTIARELTEKGIRPPLRDQGPWSPAMVLRILRNEKYCGDLLQRKYRTTDYLTHHKVLNDEAGGRFCIRDHHEGVVSREMFEAVQEELARRAAAAENRSRFSARHWYSGKIRCGLCGRTCALKQTRRADGTEYRRFVCRGRLDGAHSCGLPSVNGKVMLACVRRVMEELCLDWSAIACKVLEEVRCLGEGDSGLEEDRLDRVLGQQRARRERALEAFLDGDMGREDMRRIVQRCDRELARLEEERHRAEQRKEERSCTESRRLLELLERELAEGESVLDEAICGIQVWPDFLLIRVEGLPVPFRVRAGSSGRGRRCQAEVWECAPAPEYAEEAASFPSAGGKKERACGK